MKVGLRIPPCAPVGEIAAMAGDAERFGLDEVWFPDSQLLWRDVFTTAATAAAATTRITLGTAVTNVATRHPSVVASAARTVAELAPGRFVLGVGVGDSALGPVGLRQSSGAQLRARLAVVRDLLAGRPVDFGGVRSRLRDPLPVPIHLAASGPRNLRLAGGIADGAILLSGVAPGALSAAADRVRDGAAAAGRHPDLVHAEDWNAAVRACEPYVSDAAVTAFAREFCLYGTAAEIVDRLGTVRGAGADAVLLQHVGSYDLPRTLLADVADHVLPLLRKPAGATHG
jgi:5,10-methylenetetrahydromethanopterin reductase